MISFVNPQILLMPQQTDENFDKMLSTLYIFEKKNQTSYQISITTWYYILALFVYNNWLSLKIMVSYSIFNSPTAQWRDKL